MSESPLTNQRHSFQLSDFLLEWTLLIPMLIGGALGMVVGLGLINIIQVLKG